MNVPVSEEQIHALAFYLWEIDGSPEGRAQEYWEKARTQLATVGMLPGLQLATVPV
ncbi:DUF2934 domain-containing protein [Paraburkholderia sp. DHOC27]|uniref:DUF2934 domain-containing protein n=1 Tax=Paraburkholderia sp. DHOC27 TaxID=2303330 RepID=UPI000E3C2181|nr:DUF2934 domain-containing protein [Paraburkholderia sp. DHOC27]RFU49196.1 DUF2934 domain-containing protein [Paraburkholderia sp. DHOC27]